MTLTTPLFAYLGNLSTPKTLSGSSLTRFQWVELQTRTLSPSTAGGSTGVAARSRRESSHTEQPRLWVAPPPPGGDGLWTSQQEQKWGTRLPAMPGQQVRRQRSFEASKYGQPMGMEYPASAPCPNLWESGPKLTKMPAVCWARRIRQLLLQNTRGNC